MAQRIPAEERLMNLTVALLGTEVGLARAQIFDSVTGYVERVRQGADVLALERMFERDKGTLAELGTRIEVIGDSDNPSDMRGARYRIPRDDNSLPDDLEFTPAELAILSLAAEAWSEATMSHEARAGLRKIRALGIDVDEPILGFTPRLSARDASFAPLQAAIERGAEVRFDYLRPGSQRVRNRRVRPLALVQFEGRWHLYGRDEGVGEPRTFLLSRVVSEVQATGARFDPAESAGAPDAALGGLRAVAAAQRAHIEVSPGSEADLRLGRRAIPGAASQGVVVPYVDAYVLADEIASYGPDARVVAPPELRDIVIERLRAVRLRHSRPADPDAAETAVPVKARRKPPIVSSERVRAILTLVPWLLERGEVPVEEAAREFDVSTAELRGMLSTLSLVGAPAGGFYTGEMFDLDWEALDERDVVRLTRVVGIERVQRFTTREAAALIAGLQLIAAAPGAADADAIDALRRKLARGAGGGAIDAVAVDSPVDGLRSALSRAVRDRRAVRFSYRRPDGEQTTRTVDPSGLLLTSGEWYLQGWCHLREATRTFHLERMSDLHVTSEPADHAGEMRPELFVPGEDDVVATLRFPSRLQPLLAEFLEHAELSEGGGQMFARIPVADIGILRRLAARSGGDLEVVAPAAARDAARAWAEAGEKLHASALH
ncbi:helix-turn-helix transcriptional regulator [Microbacterium karelineae]|uniref:helix-turn-helix transcriptional regulator n=1 Tax=Microbacterium karelineae TaxID=2654283 RepID=UPI0012EA26CA|nr:WYL domain-containing protein [Microbacterium karelineae]